MLNHNTSKLKVGDLVNFTHDADNNGYPEITIYEYLSDEGFYVYRSIDLCDVKNTMIVSDQVPGGICEDKDKQKISFELMMTLNDGEIKICYIADDYLVEELPI